MIESLISSWALFHHSYLVGWLIALLLSLLGVWIVARNQIFIGAAIAQTSTLGIAVGLWLAAFQGEKMLAIFAVVFSMAASLLMARGGEKGRASRESLTGLVFLFSAALAILLVSKSPHGLEEVHRLLSSSIIGATALDVGIFALLAGVTIYSLLAQKRKILLFVLDEEMAAAVGVNVKAWSILSSLWLGLTIGLALRVSGMLYTFGCLVLPALAAKYLCKEVRQMLWVSPLVAVAISAGGFVLANTYDFPPAPMTVVMLGIFSMLAVLWHGLHQANERQ